MRAWTSKQSARLAPLVAAEYGPVCWLCHGPIDMGLARTDPGGFTIDHVVPRAHGGGNDLTNLRPAHSRCNKSRGARRPGVVRGVVTGPGWPGGVGVG